MQEERSEREMRGVKKKIGLEKGKKSVNLYALKKNYLR